MLVRRLKDIVYMVLSRDGYKYGRKNLPDVKRGQIIVKLNIEVEDECFGQPVLEQRVYVENWQKGIDINDIEVNQNIITGEEAEMIRNERLEKMKHILEEQGYSIINPNGEESDEKQL